MSSVTHVTARKLWVAMAIAGLAAGAGISPVSAATPRHPSVNVPRHTSSVGGYVTKAARWTNAVQRSTGSVTVTWSAIYGAGGYNLYRSTQAGTQGSQLNTTAIHGSQYLDRTAQFGTTYYYTVVALAGNAKTPYALASATTFAQVKAQAFRADKPAIRGKNAAKGNRLSLKNGFRASGATGTAKTAIKTARAAHPLSALSGACTVALPHTLASGTETNFGCGSGASIVELLINPSSPTVAASAATCPDATPAYTDCDVHIGSGATEVVTPGTTVYVQAGQGEDAAPAVDSGDPTQGVDIIVDGGGTLSSAGTATSGQQILFDSTNNVPGTGQGQPGDWGDIAYQGAFNSLAHGPMTWTTVQNGNGVAVMDGPTSFSNDSFRNLAGNAPLDSDSYAIEDPASVMVATDLASVSPTFSSDQVAINSVTSSDGIAVGQFGFGTGSPATDTFNVTVSGSRVSGAMTAINIAGFNDIDDSSVAEKVTAHLLGDTTPQNSYEGAFVLALPFESGPTTNVGDESVALDVQGSTLSGGNVLGGNNGISGAGLAVVSVSDTGAAGISGQVSGSTLSGYGGAFLLSQSGGSGDATISNLSVSNSSINATSTGGAPGEPGGDAAAWNNGDFPDDYPTGAFGTGDTAITPTFTNDSFTGEGGGLWNWGESIGNGDSTVAPAVSGSNFNDAGYPYVGEARADGSGMAHLTGTMANSGLTSFFGTAYSAFAESGSGSTVDDPTLASLVINTTDSEGVNFDDFVDGGTGALTSAPTIQNSTINSSFGDAVHQYAEQDGSGAATVGTSVFDSKLTATSFGGGLFSEGYTFSTNAANGLVNQTSINGSTLTSAGNAAADVEAVAGTLTVAADVTAAPTIFDSTLIGGNDLDSNLAEGLLSYAENDGSGAGASNPTITASTITSSNDSLDVEGFTLGAGQAGVGPTVDEGSVLTRGSDGNAFASESFAQALGTGDAVALPSIDSSTVSNQGYMNSAEAGDPNGPTGTGGNAHAGGTYTNDTFQAGEFDDAFQGFAFADGQNAGGDAPYAFDDPTFSHDTVTSPVGAGLMSVAGGNGNPLDADHAQGSIAADLTATNTNVTAYSFGLDTYAFSDINPYVSNTTFTSDLQALNDNVASSNSTGVIAQATNDISGGLAKAITNVTSTNISAGAGPGTFTLATGGGSGSTAPTEADNTNTGTGGYSISSAGAPADAVYSVSDFGAATINTTQTGYHYNSPDGIDLENFSDDLTTGTDPANLNATLSGITNAGGNGVLLLNFAGGVSDTEATIDGLTETNLPTPFYSEAGVLGVTGSGSGDIGNVAITHSTIGDVGGNASGIELVSETPDASTPPVAWIGGNMLYNYGANAVDLLAFVPEVVGNDIWGADLSGAKPAGVYVDFNTGTNSYRHLTAQRPLPNPQLQGVVDANFIHANAVGVILDSDNLINPDVQFNDFAGPTLTSNNPVTDLAVNNSLPTNATQNWWGSTDTSLGGDVDNSCFSAAAAAGCLEAGSTVDVLPIMTSPRMTSGFYMDAYGGLHPYGGADPATTTNGPYFPNHPLARGVATDSDGLGGQVLDAYGAIHPFGNAAAIGNGPYFPNHDIARAVALLPGDDSSGYVLDGYGGVHPFGSAPAVTLTGYWPGWDVAKSIAVNPLTHGNTCVSGYVMDAYGGLHPFADEDAGDGCSAANLPAGPSGAASFASPLAKGIGLSAFGQGYTLDGWGGVHPFGGAPAVSGFAYWPGWDIARSITVTALGSGYTLDGYGGVHPFGIAPPVTQIGYWPGWDVARGID